jgi:hypothetical protein
VIRTTRDLWTESLHPTTRAPINEGVLAAGALVVRGRALHSEDPEQQQVLLWVRQGNGIWLERADAEAARAAGVTAAGQAD